MNLSDEETKYVVSSSGSFRRINSFKEHRANGFKSAHRWPTVRPITCATTEKFKRFTMLVIENPVVRQCSKIATLLGREDQDNFMHRNLFYGSF